MDIIQLANELQTESKDLLKDEALWQPFAKKGTIHVAGSTYLDLLVFPDLDVYFEAVVIGSPFKTGQGTITR